MDQEFWDRPFISKEKMLSYEAIDPSERRPYGAFVKAAQLSNVEYKTRYGKFSSSHLMKSPPRCGRIFSGYVVVRKLGTAQEYEIWMPDHVFEEIYQPAT